MRARTVVMVGVIGASVHCLGPQCPAQALKGSDTAHMATVQKLPPNAKTRPMTAEEMKRYEAEGVAKAKPVPGPEVHAPSAGLAAIDPIVLQVLEQQKLASVPDHAPQPTTIAKPTMLQPRPGGGPSTLLSSGSSTPSGSLRVSVAPQPVLKAGRPTNSRAMAPPPTKVIYPCLSPQVTEVNRQPKNAVFTPEQQYNSYIIKGCFFGNQPGHAYLVGKFNALQVELQASYWTDTEIDARVDPATSGELDQQNVSLVVAPLGTAPIKTPGFRFVAARSGPVFLPNIPQPWLTHSGWMGQWVPPTLTYVSPVAGNKNVPSAFAGMSVYIVRSLNKKFSPGTDVFTPQLAPGWTIASVGSLISSAPPSCPGVVTYQQTFGQFFIGLTALTPDWTHLKRSGVRVSGADTSCSGFVPLVPPFGFSTYSDLSGSAYALKIWARGPRCTDPYSGQPQQQCIQNVRMCGQETCN